MDYIIDAIGEMCPLPIMRAEIKLLKLKPNDRIIMKTDHSCSSTSVINHFTSKFNYPCKTKQIDHGIWEIVIEKR